MPSLAYVLSCAYNKLSKRIKKVRGRKLEFSDRQLQILDREDIDAQIFNFFPKFYQNGRLLSKDFVFWGKILTVKCRRGLIVALSFYDTTE